MEGGINDLKQIADVGGNLALLIAVWWIRESAKADTAVAVAIARIEAKFDTIINAIKSAKE